eukprot:2212470-Prymnesium_polylepis.1
MHAKASVCTLSMSVIPIKCASLTREASTQLPSAPQPDAAISAPSAMHAPHERDSHRVYQSQTRSQCTTAPSTATTCTAAVAECNARST